MSPAQVTAGGADELRPTVSVVIPTFNRERWLPRSIGSVQAQSFPDWELLVVDDGSTDGSWSLLEQTAAADPRIRPLKNARTKGVSGARNTGIDAARGEFVAFLDSDDEWLPYHLERAVDLLVRHPDRIDLVSGCVEHRRQSSGEVYGQVEFALDEYDCEPCGDAWLFAPETLFDHALFQRPVMVTQAIVIRRKSLDGIWFPEDLRLGEDHFLHLELACRGIKVAHLQEPHVVYWAHGENTTTPGDSASTPEKTIQLYEGFEAEYLKILSRFPLTREQRRRVVNVMAQDRFWKIGYCGFRRLGLIGEARASYRRAIGWQPWNLRFWKTYIASFLRSIHPDCPESRKQNLAAS